MQQIRPLVGPMIDKRVATYELIDDPLSLDTALGGVGKERSNRFRRRRYSGQIERHASEEVCVIA